jgi:mannose-6-phosphate isomerase-like protein (cupin superfamily)
MGSPTAVEHAAAVLRASNEGEALWFRDNRMTIKARATDTGGAYGLVEAWAPAGSGPPLHVHHQDEEAFWILSGQLIIRCGEEEFTAGPGDYALLPRAVPHTFRVQGEEPAHMLTLLSPGGGEEFFALAGGPAEGPGLPAPSTPDIPALIQAGKPLGIEILGPPMAAGGRGA